MIGSGFDCETTTSPPTQGAWIEIYNGHIMLMTVGSPPTQGAWIEIDNPKCGFIFVKVAPYTGGVD